MSFILVLLVLIALWFDKADVAAVGLLYGIYEVLYDMKKGRGW